MMPNRHSSPISTLSYSLGTRSLILLLCLTLLLGVQPVPVVHAATITVTNSNDSGPGSLRQAISSAAAGDTINFSITGTITLTTGQLAINKDLTITGPGENNLTISGNNNSRVFEIASGPYDVTISGLTIANGDPSISIGGGMYNRSTGAVLLEYVTFSTNVAFEGGGLYNVLSNPTLRYVTFNNNTAVDYGGGLYNDNSSPTLENVTFTSNAADWGGGMANSSSSPTLTDVTFSGNSATHEGGGMHNNGSNPTLTNVTFTNNAAGPYGGGMYNFGSSPTLTSVSFSDNIANNLGGGMYNEDSSPTLTGVSFTDNFAPVGGGMVNYDISSPTLTGVSFSGNVGNTGGGMYNSNGSNPMLIDVSFSGNDANVGGGMYNDQSNPTLTNVIFSGNTAHSSGGMYNYGSSPTLTEVTFSGNAALPSDAGGMSNARSSNPSLTNVTFSNNTAGTNGGGMKNFDSNPILTNVTISGNTAGTDGGGIYISSNSNPILTNVTISGNTAGSFGGGIFSEEEANTPFLVNTILAGNIAGTAGPDCLGPLNSGDFNLVGNVSDCTFAVQANDLVGTAISPINPLLAALADNGGNTRTRALLTGSPAIDRIPFGVNGCGTTVSTDQRGENRPFPLSGDCDIGAYEFITPTVLPETGFAPEGITNLPKQPTEKAYTDLGSLWLEVPKLGIQAPIVGVPVLEHSWDVSWLGSNIGYLQGSAFPTWQGNTVLTAHVWDAFNRPGLFINLKQLRYGDQIKIHAWGGIYTYEVRDKKLILPDDVDEVMQHKKRDWITLLTCENYHYSGEGYSFRRMVRAILVDVNADQ